MAVLDKRFSSLQLNNNQHYDRTVFPAWLRLVMIPTLGLMLNFVLWGNASRSVVSEKLPSRGTYAGSEACKSCHAVQYNNWLKTKHARAFASLIKEGKQNKPERVRCHVTGYGERTGYVDEKQTPELKNIQCEVCHGPCAYHTKVNFIDTKITRESTVGNRTGTYLFICLSCHDEKHSAGFNFPLAMREVSHITDAKGHYARVTAPFVGSSTCKDCHPEEYAQWLGTPHAQAFSSLKGEQRKNPECVKCHTTGHGRHEGYQDEQRTPHLLNVGCESCHGGGKAHVEAEGNEKAKTLYDLGKKCVPCVVKKICRECHTYKRDRHFSAKFSERLAKVKHKPERQKKKGDAK